MLRLIRQTEPPRPRDCWYHREIIINAVTVHGTEAKCNWQWQVEATADSVIKIFGSPIIRNRDAASVKKSPEADSRFQAGDLAKM